MKLQNRTKNDIEYEDKVTKRVIFFSKEIDEQKIPKIEFMTSINSIETIEVKIKKVSKIINAPEREVNTFYIVDKAIAQELKRSDLISPMTYKKVGETLYCKGFIKWIK